MACNECEEQSIDCHDYNPIEVKDKTICDNCDPCEEGDVNCNCPIKDISTDCSVYTGEDLECSGISNDTLLTKVIKDLDSFICNKFEEVVNYFRLTNIGSGSKVYKGDSGTGSKEIRSIKQGDYILVTENPDTIEISNRPSTETQRGVAEIATQLESDAGVDNEKIITPAKLKQSVATILSNPANLPNATESQRGVIQIATQNEVDAKTNSVKTVVPSTLGTFVTNQITTAIGNIPSLPNATETQKGIAEIATQSEVNVGTDNTRFVTPAKLTPFVANQINTAVTNPSNFPSATITTKGVVELATQAEVNTGTDSTRAVTPNTLKTYVDNSSTTVGDATETAKGIAEIATQNEVNAGVDNTRFITPAKLQNKLGNLQGYIDRVKNIGTVENVEVGDTSIPVSYVTTGDVISCNRTARVGDLDTFRIIFANNMSSTRYYLKVFYQSLGDPQLDNDKYSPVFKPITTNSVDLFIEASSNESGDSVRMYIEIVQA